MVAKAFSEILDEAIDDLSRNGFDSADRIAYWQERIREAAERAMRSPDEMERMVREAMIAVYRKLVEQGVVLKYHPALKRFNIDMVAPHLRRELDKRIMAATDLIVINRKAVVEKTNQRFSGWSTSIPAGGSETVDKAEVRRQLKKPVAQQKFEENRVLIDQGHKLRASISDVIAVDNGAIALIWHSHWRQANYNYREDHKDRDLHVYAIRGNWALTKGLMKAGPDGYYDQITAVAEEPFCRCYAQWIYNVSSLPPEMLTEFGKAELERARAVVKMERK
jgi:hypothetical protein